MGYAAKCSLTLFDSFFKQHVLCGAHGPRCFCFVRIGEVISSNGFDARTYAVFASSALGLESLQLERRVWTLSCRSCIFAFAIGLWLRGAWTFIRSLAQMARFP